MSQEDTSRKWSALRFAIVGELLASPPQRGELHKILARLAAKEWVSPSGERRRFGVSTIERWYYRALGADQPTEALRRRIRSDAGAERIMPQALLEELRAQYLLFPHWGYKLQADNLSALVEEKSHLGPAPSAATVRRRMIRRGWRKKRLARTPGQKQAEERLDRFETRSYEKQNSHALWHFDYHECKRSVVMPDGNLLQPRCLCILDDYSRLCCHMQWYYSECTETLAHGLAQAFLKRGLPRSFLSDNGKAMLASEIQNAVEGLGIKHETTLPYSPHQNGKQETFWETLEIRLMAMLSAVKPLRLEFLNHATQAWAEQEYNRSRHSELGTSPLQRVLDGPSMARHSPQWDRLRFHFTRTTTRTQRRSDGTVSVKGVRFEVPSRMRHLDRLTVRFAHWDLSQVFVVNPRHHTQVLCTIHPLDKARNADGRRRALEPLEPAASQKSTEPIPPLMRKLLTQYDSSGQPPAYLPHVPAQSENDHA